MDLQKQSSEKIRDCISHNLEFIHNTLLFLLFIFLQQKMKGLLARNPEDSYDENAIKTIYVSGIKDSTTTDAITYFFENKKRTGGGNLREGKEGFKKLSETVARLTFVSSKGIVNSVSYILIQSAFGSYL